MHNNITHVGYNNTSACTCMYTVSVYENEERRCCQGIGTFVSGLDLYCGVCRGGSLQCLLLTYSSSSSSNNLVLDWYICRSLDNDSLTKQLHSPISAQCLFTIPCRIYYYYNNSNNCELTFLMYDYCFEFDAILLN